MKKYTISVIIPAFNEEQNVSTILGDAVSFLEKNAWDYEILFFNDQSKDATLERARAWTRKNKKIKVVANKQRIGFGGIERKGIEAARMELVTLIPADNQFHVKDLRQYLDVIGDCDIVLGYRIKRMDPLMRQMNARIYKWAIAFLFRVRVFKDIDWVKMYRREVFKKIRITSTTAFVDAEILIKADRLKYRIREIGTEHFPRKFGRSTGGDLKIIIRQLHDVLRYWLLYKKRES